MIQLFLLVYDFQLPIPISRKKDNVNVNLV